MDERTRRIRELNDELRTGVSIENLVVTRGVTQLPLRIMLNAIHCMRTYKDFSPDNDPFDEHDFGSFILAGRQFFWKIDYYDLKIEYHSEDPADPEKTHRVITLMLAEEY